MSELQGIETPIRMALAMGRVSKEDTDALLAEYRVAIQRAGLTADARAFLMFALELAFDRMVSDDGFTDDDWAAHAALKRLAGGES